MSGAPMAALAEDVNAEELELALVMEEHLLLDVYAGWCGPCLLLAPELDLVASELSGRCRVVKFDSEQEPGGSDLAAGLEVGGLPTLLFIKEGSIVHRVEGALQADRILTLAKGVFFNDPASSGCSAEGRSGPVSMVAGQEKKRRRGALDGLPFLQARAMARAMGMASKDEWDEYSCPGAYRLPCDPDVVWAADWAGWDDWLGVVLPFDEARGLVHGLSLKSKEEYEQLLAAGAELERADPGAWNAGHAVRIKEAASTVDTGRLPALPDAKYTDSWAGWADWLGLYEADPGGL